MKVSSSELKCTRLSYENNIKTKHKLKQTRKKKQRECMAIKTTHTEATCAVFIKQETIQVQLRFRFD